MAKVVGRDPSNCVVVFCRRRERSIFMTCIVANASSTVTGSKLLTILNGSKVHNIFYLTSWITSLFSASLATNFVATGLLALRIWYLYRETSRYPNPISDNPVFYRLFRVLVDSGVLYSMTLLITLVLFVLDSNAQFIMVDIVSLFTYPSDPFPGLPPDLDGSWRDTEYRFYYRSSKSFPSPST
jgi:hypothetical protein